MTLSISNYSFISYIFYIYVHNISLHQRTYLESMIEKRRILESQIEQEAQQTMIRRIATDILVRCRIDYDIP